MPTSTESAPIVGESSLHTLGDLSSRRENEVAFKIARLILEHYFNEDSSFEKPWLFPQLLSITKAWLAKYVVCKDNTFVQMLLLSSWHMMLHEKFMKQ